MRNPIVMLLTVVLMSVPSVAPAASGPVTARPRLVLLVVADQFRADYLTRFQEGFLPAGSGKRVGGFRYLMERGAYYPFATYEVLQAMTGPGHSIISTGAYPARTGIVLNSWFDRAAGREVYCVSDDSNDLVGAPHRPGIGTSPALLSGSTVGDEMKNAGTGSKVVSVALKDRAAILLGGHRADQAVWFDEPSFSWVSSRFYFPQGRLPAWVEGLNAEIRGRAGEELVFKNRKGGCRWSDDGSSTFEINYAFGDRSTLKGPVGLEMTVDAALTGMRSNALGQDHQPDLLAVSFSSTDNLGHDAGPNDCRMEEMALHLDRAISRLLKGVAGFVPGGLQEVLIIVTADHGVAPAPAYMNRNRVDARIVDRAELRSAAEARLNDAFGQPPESGSGSAASWIVHVEDFNYYLNRDAVRAAGLSLEPVQAALKEFLESTGSFQFVMTSFEAARRDFPPGDWDRQIINSFEPVRGGDVVAILKPFATDEECATAHMTPYSYDRTVPLLLAGFGIAAGIHAIPVEAISIAPTIAWLCGVLAPALSQGRVLWESLNSGTGYFWQTHSASEVGRGWRD